MYEGKTTVHTICYIYVTLLASHVTKRQEVNIFKHEEQFIEDWL